MGQKLGLFKLNVFGQLFENNFTPKLLCAAIHFEVFIGNFDFIDQSLIVTLN